MVEIDERLIPSDRDKTEPGLQVCETINSVWFRPANLTGDEERDSSLLLSLFISLARYGNNIIRGLPRG